MLERLSRNWWLLGLRGLVSILLGIVAFLWPGVTFFVLIAFFAAYMFVAGIFTLVAAFHFNDQPTPWPVLVIEGIAGLAIGIITFFWPGITALAAIYTIAVWAVITGILQLVMAVRVRRELPDEILLILAGIASIIFGAVCAAAPLLGLLVYMWILGTYAIIFGILLLVFAVRVRGAGSTATKSPLGGTTA
ncbi:MAG TPA: HdeD family acid-resistance protein [Candidatus Acidoferrales bacterium]|nr:HdeD family acid-resistance protein [Candidatus Acidoferrales bacterium]